MSVPTRPTRLKIAAVLSVLVAVTGLVLYDLPNLPEGPVGVADPYALVVVSFASDVLAFVAAFGTWRRERWGIVLCLVVNLYWVVQAVTTVVNPSQSGDTAFALVMLAIHAVTFWCLLARAGLAIGRPAVAGVAGPEPAGKARG